MDHGILQAVGGEAGCRHLSETFYARVARDPILRRLFPGKTLRCATEEFAAFLIQFLGGDERQTQARWWLSLRESHTRFTISSAERTAWLKHMAATLDALSLDDRTRSALKQFFGETSAYVASGSECAPKHEELAARWEEQRSLDGCIAAIASGRCNEAIALAPRFASRPSVLIGLMARMVQSQRAEFVAFTLDELERTPSLARERFAGRSLLHFAAGAGCIDLVERLLTLGIHPDEPRSGGHTALYDVANQCASGSGPHVVRLLVQAGADVNACGGTTRSTPLHMAARRGHVEIARALIDCGADITARDRKGDTPLQRAMNCRKAAVVQLLMERTAAP